MKVCLINPPWKITEGVASDVYQPMGLAYIASYLKKFGHDVTIIDAIPEGWKNPGKYWGLSPKEIISRVGKINPDLVEIPQAIPKAEGLGLLLSVE